MNTASSFCELTTTLLLVQGPDAKKFLQGQVTCDIDKLSIGTQPNDTAIQALTHSLGAHCNHKGRIVFNFRAVPLDNETIALSIPTSMLDIARAALAKYIVFSKATIEETDQYQFLGVQLESQEQHTLASHLGLNHLPEGDNQAYQTTDGIILCVAPDRYELWLEKDTADKIKANFSGKQVNSSMWKLAKINQGIADIVPKTSEKHTPHAINFQSIGTAISFDKGCYTGQEVVARMQYLGNLKRQLFLFDYSNSVLTNTQLGDAVYTPGKTQAIGEIVILGAYDEGLRLLVSVTTEYAQQNLVYLDENCTHKLDKLEFMNQ